MGQSRAIVLGGTSGLGYEIAKLLLRQQITPVVVGRTAPKLKNDPELPGAELVELDLAGDGLENIERIIGANADYFFWVAGHFLPRQPFHLVAPEASRLLYQVHLERPKDLLRQFIVSHMPDRKPFHLVVVASTSSWRLRRQESEYCSVEAAKAHLTRQLAQELPELLPGSKTLLVEPGGMNTPLWKNTDTDTSDFMDPLTVATLVINEVQFQTAPFVEMNIVRSPDNGPPIVTRHSIRPETMA